MLDDPTIRAECDGCGAMSPLMLLAHGAEPGLYSEARIPAQLALFGWRQDGNRTLCPVCVSSQERPALAQAS